MHKIKKRRILFTLLMLSCVIVGCGSKKEANSNKPNGKPFNHGEVWKNSFHVQPDGWVYELSITSKKINSEEETIVNNYDLEKDFYFAFTGINLKYKNFDNAGIPIVDSESGQVLGEVKTSVPNLSSIAGYKEEVKAINDYFLEKKFLTEISLSDVEGLAIELIDKEILVQMYNEALAYTPEKFGAFAFIPLASLIQKEVGDETWQGGYIVGYGEIAECRFEVIENGSYLSDLVINKTATEEQRKIQENIDQLEEYIIETQIFSIEGIQWKNSEVMSTDRLHAIDGILKSLYKGNQFGEDE